MFENVIPEFIERMEEIGKLGLEKYKENSFQHKKIFEGERNGRQVSGENARHSEEHWKEYLLGVPHDHFKTLEHQLAAVAFNAMMEYYFFKKESQLLK